KYLGSQGPCGPPLYPYRCSEGGFEPIGHCSSYSIRSFEPVGHCSTCSKGNFESSGPTTLATQVVTTSVIQEDTSSQVDSHCSRRNLEPVSHYLSFSKGNFESTGCSSFLSGWPRSTFNG
ncbi:hypothetical protein CFOL_v3_33152, partial [Cephalotus follicularis]